VDGDQGEDDPQLNALTGAYLSGRDGEDASTSMVNP